MVKRTTTRRTDRAQAPKYADTGRVFLASARALSDVADDDAPYGNAIALLAIHATISYTDALSIAYGEKRSADEHTKAVETLRSILGSLLPETRAKQLRKVLLLKDTVSYQGSYYSLAQGKQLLEVADSYGTWAAALLEQRPA